MDQSPNEGSLRMTTSDFMDEIYTWRMLKRIDLAVVCVCVCMTFSTKYPPGN